MAMALAIVSLLSTFTFAYGGVSSSSFPEIAQPSTSTSVSGFPLGKTTNNVPSTMELLPNSMQIREMGFKQGLGNDIRIPSKSNLKSKPQTANTFLRGGINSHLSAVTAKSTSPLAKPSSSQPAAINFLTIVKAQQSRRRHRKRPANNAAPTTGNVKIAVKKDAVDSSPGRPAGPSTLWPPAHALPFCDGSASPSLTLPAELSSTTWKGFGTSLAWWANYVGSLADVQVSTILDLLFSPEGLGLTVVRYNIGGGHSAQFSPQFLNPQPSTYKWRAMPGFKAAANAAYDWSADQRQLTVLLGAKQRGANYFQAFSNAPPWFMTLSQDVAGSADGSPNFDPSKTNDFANFLADVVQHFATDPTIGVTFDTLEPFNEPSRAWKKGNNQEGCGFHLEDQVNVLNAVAQALTARGSPTKVTATDDWLQDTTRHLPKLPEDKIAQVSVHGYFDPTINNANIDDMSGAAAKLTKDLSAGVAAAAAGKDLIMSEWGPLWVGGQELDLALYMARRIAEDVNYMGVSAWVYWQALDTMESWTLVQMDWTAEHPIAGVKLMAKYWVLKQFTAAAPPGSKPVIIAAPFGHSVVAFYHEQKQQLGIVVVNQQSADQVLSLTLPAQWKLNAGGSISPVAQWRTSPYENFKRVKYTGGYGTMKLISPGRSVSSFIISNVQKA